MLSVIALFPAVKGLRRDVKIVAGESSIMIMEVVVIKLFQPLPVLYVPVLVLRDLHNATIIAFFHNSCVTHLAERVLLSSENVTLIVKRFCHPLLSIYILKDLRQG
jgi:hypothetical protein